MKGKHLIETSNKVKLRINRVRINRAWPVSITFEDFAGNSDAPMVVNFFYNSQISWQKSVLQAYHLPSLMYSDAKLGLGIWSLSTNFLIKLNSILTC